MVSRTLFVFYLFHQLTRVHSTLNYNSDCTKAIRQVGLPRLWRDEDNTTHPLKYILPIAFEYHQRDERQQFESIKQVEITRPLLSCLSQDSPQLIDMIRSHNLEKPNPNLPYQLQVSPETFLRSTEHFGDKLALEVDSLVFKGKLKDGFFIEAGGHNFEYESTSLYFELKYNWTGLIVEPNKLYYSTGIQKNRKVFSTNSCLSMHSRPDILKYSITEESTIEDSGDVDMQCFPLYSMLLAAGNPTVNYMSLDIEGGEFQVLLTIPWEKVDIEVMSIESHFMGEKTPGTLADVVGYLEEKGYTHIVGAHKSQEKVLGLKVFQESVDENQVKRVERIHTQPGASDGGQCGGKQFFLTNELFVRKDVAEKYGL